MDKDQNVSRLDYQIVGFCVGYLLADFALTKALDWLEQRNA